MSLSRNTRHPCINIRRFDDIHQVKLHEVGTHQEGQSEFYCYMQHVKNEAQVQQGMAKMKIKYSDARHIITVYCIEDTKGPYKQGFAEDVEHGAGWRMLETLKEQSTDKIVVHVTRYHNYDKLGPRHFQIYKDLTKKAVKQLNQKLARLSRISRQHRSSLQLSQLSLISSLSQDDG